MTVTKKIVVKAMRMGKNALIVLRTSGADKGNGLGSKHGKEVQYAWCEVYANAQGYTLAPLVFYDDGVSGTNRLENRPGMIKALMYAESNDIDVIIMMDSERLGREAEAFSSIRSTFIQRGIRLETAKERLEHTNPANKFMSNIYSAVAEQDKDNTVQKLHMGRKVKAKRDGMGSGFMPYGYYCDKGVIKVNKDAIDTIKAVYHARIELKLSYRKACEYLELEGHLTPFGNTQWGVSSIQCLEKQFELYRTGIRVWGDINASNEWPIIIK